MIDEKNFEKIETFLSTVEGRRQDVGYIPCNCVFKAGKTANYRGEGDPDGYPAMGASGVTIATGVDLGQTDVATLKKIGVIDAVIEQLMPYIGLRRDDAIRAVDIAMLLNFQRAGILSRDAVLLAARDSGLLPDDFDVDADAERMARDTMGNGSNAGVKSLAAML